MKTRTKILTPYGTELKKYEAQLASEGYRKLPWYMERVPKGTNKKVCIHLKRWCGEWNGFEVERNAVVWYK